MSDQTKCVCGGLESEHTLVKRARDGKILFRGHCRRGDHVCYRFRAALDWPDAEGLYWVFGKNLETVVEAVGRMPGHRLEQKWADKKGRKFFDFVVRSWCSTIQGNTQMGWTLEFGVCKFVRCEKPFTIQGDQT